MHHPRVISCLECCRKHSVKIPNVERLKHKLSRFARFSRTNIQCVADFDYTLTRFRVRGKTGAECHDIIEHSPFMPDAFRAEFKQVWEDSSEARVRGDPSWEPETWWHRTHALMVKYGLQKSWIANSVRLETKPIALREQVDHFMADLRSADIPLTIVSAGLCDVINEVFLKDGVQADGIKLFANRMVFDDNGVVQGFSSSVISSANKRNLSNEDEFVEHFRGIGRRAAIILGDNPNDCTVVDQLSSIECILSIGFWDMARKHEQQEAYELAFDIIIPVPGDAEDVSFELVRELVGLIIEDTTEQFVSDL